MEKLNLSEIRRIQLRILKAVAEYCSDNGLAYSLGYGSLIGAIRHQGYIPWDDDIDVVMPRPDYERFIRGFPAISQELVLHAPELDCRFPYPFAKVSDRNTLVVEDLGARIDLGVNIDIFPLDGINPMDTGLLRRQTILKRIRDLKVVKVAMHRGMLKNSVLIAGKILFCLLPLENINMRMVRGAKKYQFEEEEHCCIIVTGDTINKIVPRRYFEEFATCVFEGETFMMTRFYHEWLTSLYGDYMTPPPPDKRISHHVFRAYRRI